jgi:hypothetical protein
LLRGQAMLAIVRPRGEGAGLGRFGGAAIAEEFPGADEIRPTAPRIIGEPEAVCAEDEMRGEHGGVSVR